MGVDAIMEKLVASAEFKGLDGCGTFTGTMAGRAAQAAANVLLKDWAVALADGSKGNLVADMEDAINELRQFRIAASVHLPLQNGGLGGFPAQHWMSELSSIKVSVYEADDRFCFGFTGCARNNYRSLTDALVAAVLANKDVLGLKLPGADEAAPLAPGL